MLQSNTDFLKELFIIAESFTNAVIKTSSNASGFEEDIMRLLDKATPEEQSNLLFLCGMLIIQLSNVEHCEKRSAIATAIMFKDTMDEQIRKISSGGSLIKALTFPLVYPRLDRDTKNEIISSHCDC